MKYFLLIYCLSNHHCLNGVEILHLLPNEGIERRACEAKAANARDTDHGAVCERIEGSP